MFYEILIGGILAVGLVAFWSRSHPKIMIKVWQQGLVIAAFIYVVFALYRQNYEWLKVEFLGLVLYGTLAWLGTKKSVLFLGIGWSLHIFWDLLLHQGGHPGYVPSWYPGVCLGFDLIVGGYLIWHFFNRGNLGNVKSKSLLNNPS